MAPSTIRRRTRDTATAGQTALFTTGPAGDAPARAFSDRAYQRDAVARVVDGLRGGGRGQLRAACGTGKTRMAQWSAERLVPHGGIVVIVVPTVGLVAQTLAAWAESDDDHRALAVCSDDSVAVEDQASTEDILEPVTTDSDVVDAWLRAGNTAAVRLIVGTHISAHVIGAGLQKAGIATDLLVIDEAHHSAGSVGKATALLHDDEVLPAVRRLYMTATPRMWESGKASDTAVYSMDDEHVFGPVLYHYPFSRAIDEGYLDDYRLVVVGVTRAEVLAVLRNSERHLGARGRLPDEHTAMVQAATARAAAELGLRRVIAFCPLVQDAKRFADTFQQTIDAIPPALRPRRPLHAAHVHGKMKQAQRREILSRLANPPDDGWSVISNARCLSEGVDLPTVDGIAFTAPKKSPTDIVQAVGRALRRDPEGSGIATIIVPILLADDDAAADDDTIDAGSYDVLWQVVRGLRAHDDMLGNALDTCRASHFTTESGLDRLDFILPDTHTAQAPKFVEHLTIRLVKSTTSKWWDGYAHLADFHARWGHSRVNPGHITGDGFRLGNWVSATRVAYKQNRIGADRVAALGKLDFIFDARAADWERGFSVAHAFCTEHGHLRPPATFRQDNVSLSAWLGSQRAAHARGTLPADRKARLDTIGMHWPRKQKGHSHTREERLAQVRDFYTAHGRLPSQKSDPALGAFLTKMRTAYRNGTLEQPVIDALDEMGIVWDTAAVIEQNWERGLAAATRYHMLYGHLDVRRSDQLHSLDEDEGFDLVGWLKLRRVEWQKGKLTDAQITALDEQDMPWRPHQARWEHSHAACAEFYAEHGHLRVPRNHTVHNVRGEEYRLCTWIDTQRAKRDTLTDDQVLMLDKVGMDWDPLTSRWTANLVALQEFHDEHGHLTVPEDLVNDDGINLSSVLSVCRTRRRQNTLPADRIAALDALGMDWEPGSARSWDRVMEALRAYYDQHGDILVPADLTTSKGTVVADWLTLQRKRYADGELSSTQIADLNSVGMIWQKRVSRWARSLAALTAVHERYGTINVSYAQAEQDPQARQVYTLVVQYRTARTKNKLSEDKIADLDALGLDWNPLSAREQQWQAAYEAVRVFHTQHGHLDIPPGHSIGDGADLDNWLAYQKAKHGRGQLPADRAKLLDALGIEWPAPSDPWDRAIAELQDYIRTVGPLSALRAGQQTASGFHIYGWVVRQRRRAEQGDLPAERVQHLRDLGALTRRPRTRKTTAAPKRTPWSEDLATLRQYHAEHGDINVSRDREPIVGAIVARVRAARRASTLPADRIAALEDLGINWEPRHSAKQRGISAARAFYAAHGHLLPEPGHIEGDVDLAGWISARRSARAADQLTDAQIAELDALGMVWDLQQATWDKELAAATAFHAEYGHLKVPHNFECADLRGKPYPLVRFLNQQRSHRRAGTLPANRVAALDALDMGWNPVQSRQETHQELWETHLAALREYHAEHGHIAVSKSQTHDGVDIGQAVHRARRQHSVGDLAADRAAALDALGMVWSPKDTAWRQMIEFLTAYRAEHGHIRVPDDVRTAPGILTGRGTHSTDGVEVRGWLGRQRTNRAAGELSDAQIAELDALGMIWERAEATEETWRAHFAVAQLFHQQHGHLNVPAVKPSQAKEINALYNWVCTQRRLHQEGGLGRDRVALLESIGMQWNPVPAKQAEWLRIFGEVKEFREQHGHFSFGCADATMIKLGKWLTHQRNLHAKGELRPDRAVLLTEIGMDWRPDHERAWSQAVARLRTYCETEGNPNDMPAKYKSPDGFGLYYWLRRARTMADRGDLPEPAVIDLVSCGLRITGRRSCQKPTTR
ncbi:DEAD/DEAH box helicase [Amycolatopsis sp. RTGN1]|uniref:DEAD/DEAH box helicase n=1 Tax=Amycolatopsis ponsaeliensis TaxID=2992142 RepID=UPI00254D9922|nr:DEAD/DEAH box helicase [Amycolatopsis sp. RTGN1]